MEKQIWSAGYEFRYPTEVDIAWDGLTRVIADHLKGYGAMIRVNASTGTMVSVFGVRAYEQSEAEHEIEQIVESTIGISDPKPQSVRRIILMSSDELHNLYANTSDEVSKRRMEQLRRTLYTSDFPEAIKIISEDTPEAVVVPLNNN
jgi:hypothetical protein